MSDNDKHDKMLARDIAEYHTLVNGLANRIVDLERRADRQFTRIEKLTSELAKLCEMYRGDQ